jgi:predicted nucleic-acid-binding Zn-ribbon protein
MQALPRCPSCRHEEWVRANVVVVPGAQGPVRVSTSYLNGPAGWTCATCGYTDACSGDIERLLERVPEHVTIHPAMAHRLADARAEVTRQVGFTRRTTGAIHAS